MHTKTRLLLLPALLCATLAIACSESAPVSPTGPSTLNDQASTASGDVIVRPGSGGNNAAEWAGAHGWSTAADGLVVEGTDVITATTGVCPSPTITVRGVPVAVTATTTYGGAATCAGLTVGTTVSVTGVVTFTATGFSVIATHIRIEGMPSTKVEGRIATVAGACPSLTIALEGNRGVVITSAATAFDPAAACNRMVPGARIEAWGTRNATNALIAARVELEEDDDDDDDDNDNGGGKGRQVGGEGVIGAITGTCPSLTAVIGGYRVQLTAATEFVGGTCASLRPGTKVKVDARVQADGSIVADRVEIERVPGRPVSGDGRVDTVGGTCPSLTLSVQGVTVITSDTTVFSGADCGSIRAGTHIDVTGEYDGVIVTARSVAIRNNGRR